MIIKKRDKILDNGVPPQKHQSDRKANRKPTEHSHEMSPPREAIYSPADAPAMLWVWKKTHGPRVTGAPAIRGTNTSNRPFHASPFSLESLKLKCLEVPDLSSKPVNRLAMRVSSREQARQKEDRIKTQSWPIAI